MDANPNKSRLEYTWSVLVIGSTRGHALNVAAVFKSIVLTKVIIMVTTSVDALHIGADVEDMAAVFLFSSNN